MTDDCFVLVSCHINCLAKVAVTSNLQLVPQLTDNCGATFTWRLQKKSGASYGSYSTLDNTITETGNVYIESYIAELTINFNNDC